MQYSKEAIQNVTRMFNGDMSAHRWLVANKYDELIAMSDGVLREFSALKYLIKNKHYILAAFVNAVWEDPEAMPILIKQKAYQWAAAANYINEDEKAGEWLKKNNLNHFYEMADAMLKRIQSEGDDRTSLFKLGSPY